MSAYTSLSLVVHSESLTGEQISETLGLEPDSVDERGTPVSSREPGGPLREHTTWVMDGILPGDSELAEHLDAMLPLVESRLEAFQGLDASLSVMVTAAPMGNMVWLDPPLLSRLAIVGLPLALDIYDHDDEEEESP